MTTRSDDFDRANETPLAGNWATGTGESAFNLTGNVAVPSSPAGSDGCSIYTAASFLDDQSSKAELAAVGTNGSGAGIGLCVRHAPAARTYFRFTIDHAASNNAQIGRRLAGVYTALVTWTQAFTDGDEFEFLVTGPAAASLLTVYRNGTPVQSFTDNSSLASGAPGLICSTVITSGSVNDWVGTDDFSAIAALVGADLIGGSVRGLTPGLIGPGVDRIMGMG